MKYQKIFSSIAWVSVIVSLGMFGLSESFGASPTYSTTVTTNCFFVDGNARVDYQLIKNGQVLGSASLECGGQSVITTSTKPMEWVMSLKIYDVDGNEVASRDAQGRGFPASASLQFGNNDIVLGQISSATR